MWLTEPNPFLTNAPILYPLKTPENLWFSDAFRGYKMGTLARNGLMTELNKLLINKLVSYSESVARSHQI